MIRIILFVFLISIYPLPILFGAPDAFMGEGKENFIKRCLHSAEMPGFSQLEKEQLCKCYANKLESGYSDVLKSITNNDSIETAQRKMDNYMQKFFLECTEEVLEKGRSERNSESNQGGIGDLHGSVRIFTLLIPLEIEPI